MILSIILILLITLGIGLPISFLVAPKGSAIGRIGLSFLLGMGLFTLMMYVGNQLGIKFSLINILLYILIPSIPLVLIKIKSIKSLSTDFINSIKSIKLSLGEKILLTLLALLVISSFINTFYWPVYSWDSLVLYDFRAKVFAQTGFIKDAIFSAYYYGYPLLTSLSHTIVYLSGGDNPQFIYSLFYLSLGLSFYGLLREFISRRISLLFTFILLMVPLIFDHSVISYSNLPYTAFLSLGTICFYVWYKKRTQGYLILSAILVGLSAWTRSVEPYWLGVFIIVFLASILKRRYLDIIIFSLFLFPIQKAWGFFRISLSGASGDVTEGAAGYAKILIGSFDLTRWYQIINFLYQNVFLPWGAIFIVFGLGIVVLVTNKRSREVWPMFFMIVVLLSLLLLGTFTYSFVAPNWMGIGDAANRTSMIFYPLFVCATALVVGKYRN